MPFNDAEALSPEYVHDNIQLALEAYNQTRRWNIPWDIFLQYILPYASLDERRDDWRPLLTKTLQPYVRNVPTAAEAALLLNTITWQLWNITFKPNQTPDIMSPFQVIAAGHASCTGLSITLVSALRAVGVPARVVGTPAWTTKPHGNHDWVEVYTGPNEWSFMGAGEPGPFNQTWFVEQARHQVPGSEKHGIFATRWSPSHAGTHFPMMWAPASEQQSIPADDVTQAYVAAMGAS